MNVEQNINKPFLINNYPTPNQDLSAPTPMNQEDNHININQNHINKYGYFTLNPNFYMFLENQQQINIRINSEIKPMSFSIKFLPFLIYFVVCMIAMILNIFTIIDRNVIKPNSSLPEKNHSTLHGVIYKTMPETTKIR